jgi:hypothetical protein
VYRFIGWGRKETRSVFGEGDTLYCEVMIVKRDERFSLGYVPYSNFTIVRTGNHFVKGQRAFCKHTDTIRVSFKSAKERFSEYFVEFSGIECTLKLASAWEGMLCIGCSHNIWGWRVGDGRYFDHCWSRIITDIRLIR